MIIGACGFGSTGSSVVTDYLKEYNDFHVLDEIEFTWVSGVDGLIDLDFHVNHPHCRTMDSITAIDRYIAMCKNQINCFKKAGIPPEKFIKLTEEFLESIITTSWQWNIHHQDCFWDRIRRSYYSRLKIVPRWEVKHGRHWEGFPLETVNLSVLPEDFEEKAKKHVRDILRAMGADFSKPIILDQPFAGNNPQACFKFYDDPYAVVVDRDPRDNYVFAKTKLLGRFHLMPINDVEDFVKYYRALRKNQPYSQPHERVLVMKFEDFVYHYDDATTKLRNFFHLPDNPNPKSIFDPAISMPNTRVWKRYPQFATDIDYIEKELPEYLFDYTGCPEPDLQGEMFWGKSPKNK
ncbi:MAG: hypothetical protein IJK20_03455 [Bacteroidales bacterium]|nr:hypothetical protein [Bacteroidales bacterium]